MPSCELLEPSSELHRLPRRSRADTAPVVLSILGMAGATRSQIGGEPGTAIADDPPDASRPLFPASVSPAGTSIDAAALVEYALIIALVALLAAATMFLLGTQISQVLSIVGNAL
jgi:Flp pilus assembly pilin Flp